MELTTSEREQLKEIVKSHRENHDFSRSLQRDRYSEPHRLLAQQCERAEAFLDSQWRAFAARSGAVAQHHQETALRRALGFSSYRPLGIHDQLVFKSFITLDKALDIEANPHSHSSNHFFARFDVRADLPTSGHNFVKADALQQTSVEYGFHIPGIPIPDDIQYLFAFRPDSDIALNAIAFVQPNGRYWLHARWQPGATSKSTLNFTAGLDVHIFGSDGGRFISNGTRDDRLTRSLDVGPWDLFNDLFDVGPYNDQSTLFDNNYITVSAGSLIVFHVWVALTVWSDGNAYSNLDFQSGDFGINVPAVYVSTFEVPPIP